ncbi:MAG: L-seryl-tRNA(Sec) selenium transferase [Proteobacteria bacterium]|nr:L-seryl-tRNA(Sec) selenium transferase [Pseudomonadota bacterium]
MPLKPQQQDLLKKLPGVDTMIERLSVSSDYQEVPRRVILQAIRLTIDGMRSAIIEDRLHIPDLDLLDGMIDERVGKEIKARMTLNLKRVINATGVVIHTNLGRSLLAEESLAHITDIASRYSNLELNLETGKRGLRYSAVESLLCDISGAESALVVNNNAAAVLLCLDTLACGKEVIVSRGELVEIGGSFRIPDVMEKSGGFLKEVGTTNRTHPQDYTRAITEKTGLLLKVHTSNYSIQGFTASVSLTDMVAIGREHAIPVMEDLGSGTFVDFSKYGLAKEPTVQESVAAGCDIVTFSGDKLLGGPQAGIIIGSKHLVDAIKKNPLTRALRIDKMTLAALESTLRLYLDEEKAISRIPTLRMLTMSKKQTNVLSDLIIKKIRELDDPRIEIQSLDLFSKAGGGSLPLLELPSTCVAIRMAGLSTHELEQRLRSGCPPLIARIENDLIILDPRTLQIDEPDLIRDALDFILRNLKP